MGRPVSGEGVARDDDAPWLTLKMREAMEAWLFLSPTLAGFLIFFARGPIEALFGVGI